MAQLSPAVFDLESLPMRIALGQSNELSDEYLAFAVQCGVHDVQLNTPKLPGDARWEFEDLAAWSNRAADFGLRLICIENVPVRFYDEIMLGGPARDAQLENMIATVRNMGRAGVPILGYHWMPNGVWRTQWDTPVRGGAVSNAFRYSDAKQAELTHGRVYSEEEMWSNYDWYLDRILPVCEEAEVRLALHPDDPPVPVLGGIARLFRNLENFQRAMTWHSSQAHGLDYCHGCWSEMHGGSGVLESLEWFGSRGRIFYVHLRDVQGDAEDFRECFIDEGNGDPYLVMKTLRNAGFNGFIIDDHVPHMVGDSSWGHRGRAYATGYLRGILDSINRER